MDQLFWITQYLAGRPGPDFEAWNIAALRRGGIRAILSVNDGFLCDPEELSAHGIAYASMPLSANAPPQRGDEQHCMAALPNAYEFVCTHLRKRHRVVAHCFAGNDRTGLFLSYFLVRYNGISPDEAIHAVRQVRSSALTAPG